ncbi:MAG: hypothetical protein PQJ46_04980 [Spirochaetales bacterium]|nr:hypothetical protein [Spirochaetales bacterium]
MIQLGRNIKLNVRPIYITLAHEYAFEGPCRAGAGEELKKAFDDKCNNKLVMNAESVINDNITDEINLLEPIRIERNEEFMVTPSLISRMSKDNEEIDVYLISALTRLGDLIIDFAQKTKKPVVLVPSPVCMQTIMTAAMRARELESYSFRTWKETINFLEVLRVKKILASTRVLCAPRFGTTRSVSDMANFKDLEQVSEKLGTQFSFVNIHELIDQTQIVNPCNNVSIPGRKGLNPCGSEIKAISETADKLIEGAEECDMSKEELINSLRPHTTIKKMLEHYECNAFTAPCPDACATMRLNDERYTFCLTHTLLSEEGIPSSCEYDISAVLTMAILSGFADAPAYMGNTTHDALAIASGTSGLPPFFNKPLSKDCMAMIKNDPENIILTWHAVPRRNMKGYDQPKQAYAIRPFTASGFGATIRYDFNNDNGTVITMARIDPACEKLFIARGEIIGGIGYDDYSCSEGVFFRVADGNDFYQKQLNFGNHVPLVYGDYIDKLKLLGKQLGLEVIIA